MLRTKRTIENIGSLNKKAQKACEPFLCATEAFLDTQGVSVEVISGLRSWQAQAALYAQGRTKPGPIVTNARPGSSWHNYGLAIDLGLFKAKKYLDESSPKEANRLYSQIGKIAAQYGIEWGGSWATFKDIPHFQVTFGKSLAEMRSKMETVGYDINKLV